MLFAGFLRAPLTSVFMVIEVSGNYSIVLPVILANTVAYLLSRTLQPTPIFEIFTHQDGLDLPSMEEQREERGLHIEDALRPIDVPVFRGADTLATVSTSLTRGGPFLICLNDATWYAMTSEELTAALASLHSETPLEKAIRPDRTPVLFPDLPLDSTLAYFARWPVLPIRNRASKGTIEGIVTSDDVLRTYQEK